MTRDRFAKGVAPGEVWSAPCDFTFRDDGVTLRPGLPRNDDGSYGSRFCGGAEVRTVVAVVSIPGHQRRVVYKRQFAPDGYAPFGKQGLHFTAISNFNRWLRGTTRRGRLVPATRVQPGIIEQALALLTERNTKAPRPKEEAA